MQQCKWKIVIKTYKWKVISYINFAISNQLKKLTCLAKK